jgi:hypothetical protein
MDYNIVFKIRATLLMAVSTGLLSGCQQMGTLTSKEAISVELGHDAYVATGNGELALRRKGEQLENNGEPLRFYAPGKVTAYLVPVGIGATVKIDLPSNENWASEKAKETEEKRLTHLLESVRKVQEHIANRRTEIALIRLDSLKTEFPSLKYLELMRASCLVILGRMDEAKSLLADLAEKIPENLAVKKLMGQIREYAH